jgi:hypothetical protein
MKRTIRFCVLLNPTERLALDQLADVEGGLSLGALIRRLVRGAALEQGLWPGQQCEMTRAREDSQTDALVR